MKVKLSRRNRLILGEIAIANVSERRASVLAVGIPETVRVDRWTPNQLEAWQAAGAHVVIELDDRQSLLIGSRRLVNASGGSRVFLVPRNCGYEIDRSRFPESTKSALGENRRVG